MSKLIYAGALAAAIGSCAAQADTKLLIQPLLKGDEVVRFDRGTPTVDIRKASGAVQVVPLPFDHGSLSFSVVVWNSVGQASNFGVENVAGIAGQQPLVAFSKDQLVHKAENRAMWSQIGLAALGGLAAAAAANQQDTISARTVSPWGVSSTTIRYRSSTADLQSAAAIAGTGVAIAAVQSRLDETRAALGDQIIQTTTVDPYDSYGGRVVLEKIKAMQPPQEVTLKVSWNGETYPFTFRLVKYGTPWPVYPRPAPSSPSAEVASPSASALQLMVPPAVIPVATQAPTPSQSN